MSHGSRKILPATQQPPQPSWTSCPPSTYSTATDDRSLFLDMTFDPDGNCYVVGTTTDTSNTLYHFSGMFEGNGVIVIKFNTDLQVVWKKFVSGGFAGTGITYMHPSSGTECVIVGTGYVTSSTGNMSFLSFDCSNGNLIDTREFDNGGYVGMPRKLIPHPTIDNYVIWVGQIFSSGVSRERPYGGNVWLNSNGTFQNNGIVERTTDNSTYSTRNGSWTDICYDSTNDAVFFVGRWEQSGYYQLFGYESVSTFTIPAGGYLHQWTDYTNGYRYTSIVCDSSGVKYMATEDGQITAVDWTTDGGTVTTDALWRVEFNTNGDRYGATYLALSTDENYLYVVNSNFTVKKVSTSDGSLVAEMAIPNTQMTSSYGLGGGTYAYQNGMRAVYVNDGKIYITANYNARSWAWHGNLIVIPEGAFGTAFKLDNGVGLLPVDNLATSTSLGVTMAAYSSCFQSNVNASESTPSYSAVDFSMDDNQEESGNHFSIIWGVQAALNGNTSTSGTTRDIGSYTTYGTTLFRPQENDIVIYQNSSGGANYYSPSNFATSTSGFTTAASNSAFDSWDTMMLVQWKRMTSTPDTQINISRSLDAANGTSSHVIFLRNLNSDATPYSQINYGTITNTGDITPPAITTTGAALIMTVVSNVASNARLVQCSDSSWNDYTHSTWNAFGSDTYDSNTIIAFSTVDSATTFTPNLFSASATRAEMSGASITFEFPIG